MANNYENVMWIFIIFLLNCMIWYATSKLRQKLNYSKQLIESVGFRK